MPQTKRISVKQSNEFHKLFYVDSSTVLNDSINPPALLFSFICNLATAHDYS
jgi:hypothetical protein